MQRIHVLGPPGTGKTAYLQGFRQEDGSWRPGQVQRAAETYGPDRVLVVTLTRAAASELASRNKAVPRRQIGTLHSICRRALEAKILTAAQILDFLSHHKWRIAPGEIISDERSDEASSGFYQRYDLLRHRLVDPEKWPSNLRRFHEQWSAFKREVDAWDFTDLIERGLTEVDPAPGDPRAIFADEAQDFSALEVACLLRWGRHCESLVLVGDALQALYAWRGADPTILSPDLHDHQRVLSQSWRVPAAVHARAVRVVRGLPGSDAEYLPTSFEGAVRRCRWSAERPADLLREIGPRIDRGDSAVVLAPCAFSLARLTKECQRQGIPYHNPWNKTRWNPLANRGMVRRLVSWLRPRGDDPFFPEWTPAEVRYWSVGLRAQVFVRGGPGRDVVSSMAKDADPTSILLAEIKPEHHEALMECDPRWLIRSSTAAMRGRQIDYVRRVLDRLGPKRFVHEIETRPWLGVGTIHSSKGGEADIVAILPDLSPKGVRQRLRPGWENADALKRLAYVALTRARSQAWIGRPVSAARALKL